MLIRILHKSGDDGECLRFAKEEYDLLYGSAESGPVCNTAKNEGGQKIWTGISVSEGLRVCALSNQPVGICIKRMTRRNFFAISSRFFCPGEATPKRYRFYKLWTSKAALAALTGEQLPEALKRCDYGTVSHFEFLYGYALAVAGKGQIFVGLFSDR
jgi:phosphopantetheinyl transferase